MPRQTQIVPEKKYPFVETFYNDYSGYTDTTTVTPTIDGFRSMSIFGASKGIDNKLVTIYSNTELEEEFGTVDFKLYGQAMLNAYKMLESKNAIVHCMRVLPADANLANVMVIAKVKITKKTGTTSILVPAGFKAVASTVTTQVSDGLGGTTDLNTHKVTLDWTAEVGALSYDICINNETSNLITTATKGYVHNDLIAENGYTYKIRVTTASGTSAWSNVISIVAGSTGAEATKTATDIPTTDQVPDKMVIKYECIATDGIKKESDLEATMSELAGQGAVDADGFLTVPIFTLFSLGRGIYGNNYRFRITDSAKLTEEYDTCVSQIELYDASNGIKLKERYYVSLNPADVFNKQSIFVSDVISDPDDGSGKIGAVGNEDGLQVIYDMYNEAFPTAAIELGDFNIITGIKSDLKTAVPNLTIYAPATEAETAVSLSTADGIPFAYGSDGSFAISNPSLSTAIDASYVEAFEEKYDMGVISKRRFPTEVIFDANYSLEGKMSLATLVLKRTDCQLILDAGLISSKYEAYNWADSNAIASIDDWAISKVFQHAAIKDPFTQRTINVTATYFYADLMPNHYFVVGRHIPMVGKDYGVCSGIIKNKIYPLVEYDDDTTKTALAQRHLNWIEAVDVNLFTIGVQDTSQMAKSDMVEMSNAAVLLAMKRILDNLCVATIYKFGEEDDRIRYTEDANSALEDFKGMVKKFSVEFNMNKFEQQRNIMHCYLSVTFKTIVKNVIVEIDINSRVSS